MLSLRMIPPPSTRSNSRWAIRSRWIAARAMFTSSSASRADQAASDLVAVVGHRQHDGSELDHAARLDLAEVDPLEHLGRGAQTEMVGDDALELGARAAAVACADGRADRADREVSAAAETIA